MKTDNPNTLLVVWTSGEREVALNMVLMYTYNSKVHGWWENLTLLIWGASTKLLSEDALLQEKIKEIKDAGIRVIACKKCAENYGIVEKIESMGIEVFYTGEFLTDWIKSGESMVTF
jgi:hypothetical protein